jgi:hypothetical protein
MAEVTEPGFAANHFDLATALFDHQSCCFQAQSGDGIGRRIRD